MHPHWTALTLCTLVAAVASAAEPVDPAASSTVVVAPQKKDPTAYVAAFLGTTLATRATEGALGGPLGDVSPMLGVGYLLDAKWAVELDLGPTLVVGTGYTALAVVPGLVFTANDWLYACLRACLTVHPTPLVSLMPGVGVSKTFESGWAPFAELDLVVVSSASPRGGADLAAAIAVGVSRYF